MNFCQLPVDMVLDDFSISMHVLRAAVFVRCLVKNRVQTVVRRFGARMKNNEHLRRLIVVVRPTDLTEGFFSLAHDDLHLAPIFVRRML